MIADSVPFHGAAARKSLAPPSAADLSNGYDPLITWKNQTQLQFANWNFKRLGEYRKLKTRRNTIKIAFRRVFMSCKGTDPRSNLLEDPAHENLKHYSLDFSAFFGFHKSIRRRNRNLSRMGKIIELFLTVPFISIFLVIIDHKYAYSPH
jgi:hypothetical protein